MFRPEDGLECCVLLQGYTEQICGEGPVGKMVPWTPEMQNHQSTLHHRLCLDINPSRLKNLVLHL